MDPFDPNSLLPAHVMADLTDVRVNQPSRVLEAGSRRVRPSTLTRDGRLNLLAIDHPARGVNQAGSDPMAMADRRGLLGRIVRTLQGDGVDGVMATLDLLQDLLVLDDLLREAGGPPLLDGKVLLASLNRGGLAGSAWELDDPITGATPESCARLGLDGAKLLLRIAPEDPGCLATIQMCAEAINELNALGLPIFLEPLPVVRKPDHWAVVNKPDALAQVVGVASALGDSSHGLWLKLPWCEGFETVARSTSLPILLLGGPTATDTASLLTTVADSMAAGPNVRGGLVGRGLLFPGIEDPLVVATSLTHLIHRGAEPESALQDAQAARGTDMDALTRWLGGEDG
jgi:DhnA family fructose-bisphosphate aldolase class Ia